MRVIPSERKRPLDLLAIGAGGHVAAACSVFGVQGDVEVWDVASGTLMFAHTLGIREVMALAFTPDGRSLFCGVERGFAAYVMDTWKEWPRPLMALSLGSPRFVFSTAGDVLLTTEWTNQAGGVDCLVMDDGWPLRPQWIEGPRENHWYGNPSIQPDGMRVAVSTHDNSGDRMRATIQLRDALTGKILTEIPTDAADPIKQLTFTADSASLMARSSGRSVKMFDSATGASAGELVHPGRPYVTGMAVHPGGLVACSRNNGTVCFWNVEKRELVRVLDWKLGKLVSVAFSPDGNIGAAGTEDGQVILWDVDV